MSADVFEAVVWDLDGTLIDSAPDIAASVNRVLKACRLPELALADIRLMVGHGAGKLLERAFSATNGLHKYQADEAYNQFVAHYKDNSCVMTTFYPGVEALLSSFRHQQIPQGICTNKPYSITAQILRQLEVFEYFGAVIGGDSTAERKPSALPLQVCIEQLGVEKHKVLMIGDSSADVGAASACGVSVAVVPWGYRSGSARDMGGDYALEDISELTSLIKKH